MTTTVIKKGVLSNSIYLNVEKDSKLFKELDSILTYKIDQTGPGGVKSLFPRVIKNMRIVSPTVVSIPSGREDLIPEGYIMKDKRCYADAYIPDPTFVLREDQKEIIDAFESSCLLHGKPGWGKSIAGLAMAHKLQMKTLVICTTTAIRDMWVGEIRKFLGFEPGVIGSGKFDIGPAIVVSNIQTLRKHGLALSNTFGFVITDECHHCTASTFTDFLVLSKASVKVGLSGTIKRKDEMHLLFSDYFSKLLFSPKVANTHKPIIHMYDTGVELGGTKDTPWALRVNELTANPKYCKLVASLAKGYARLGHRVLVVCDRIDLLKTVHNAIDTSLLIVGTVELDDRLKVMAAVSRGEADVLCASQSIFAEGISLNELSCVILATPINNESLLEQITGRIQRMCEGKLHPIVVDLRLEGGTGYRHRTNRRMIYNQNGWTDQVYMDVIKLLELVEENNKKSVVQ